MKGLLDTHTFLWWGDDSSKLSPTALAFLQDPTDELFLSVVSVWEIIIKQQLGKLIVHSPLTTILAQQQLQGLTILSLSLDHVFEVEKLPNVDKDPFDRLLIAQTIFEGASLVCLDSVFSHYPIKIIW